MEYLVKDLMVPISEYATVPKGSTLFEAVLALERAQEAYDQSKYRHRAVLIMDSDNRVVGKLSQFNVLQSLVSGNRQMEKIEQISQFGFSSGFISSLQEQRRMKGRSLKEICSDPAKMMVEDFMNYPSEDEYIDVDASLEMAIHQLSKGPYLSLMVLEGNETIGILRLSDVFGAIFHAMKESVTID